MQIEKQKNNRSSDLTFKCYYITKDFKKGVKAFLQNLQYNDTFLLARQRYNSRISLIEVSFLASTRIQQLNKEYRQMDYVPDVLSFNLDFVGEVDLCLDVIKQNADLLNVDFGEEVYRCIIHGILHTLGWDHESKLDQDSISQEEMFLFQEKILSECHTK